MCPYTHDIIATRVEYTWNIVGIQLEFSNHIPSIFQLYYNCRYKYIWWYSMNIVWIQCWKYNQTHDVVERASVGLTYHIYN